MASSYASLHYQVIFSTRRRVPHITGRNGRPNDEPADSSISLHVLWRPVTAEVNGAGVHVSGP